MKVNVELFSGLFKNERPCGLCHICACQDELECLQMFWLVSPSFFSCPVSTCTVSAQQFSISCVRHPSILMDEPKKGFYCSSTKTSFKMVIGTKETKMTFYSWLDFLSLLGIHYVIISTSSWSETKGSPSRLHGLLSCRPNCCLA